MADLFTWVPSDGFSGWDETVNTTDPTDIDNAIGCGGAPSWTCSPRQGINSVGAALRKQVAPADFTDPCYNGGGAMSALGMYRDFSARFQYGYFNVSGSSFYEFLFYAANELIGGINSGHFHTLLHYHTATGTLRLQFIEAGDPSYFSSAGAFPIDGLPHAFQVTYHFINNNQVHVIVAVDNVTAIDITHTKVNVIFPPEPCADDWGDSWGCAIPPFQDACYQYFPHAGISNVEFANWRGPNLSDFGDRTFMGRYEEIILTDTFGLVDYPPCDVVLAIGLPPGNATITGAAWTDDHTQIIVTGTGLASATDFTAQGPGGVDIPIASFMADSDTQVTLTIDPSYVWTPPADFCVSAVSDVACYSHVP